MKALFLILFASTSITWFARYPADEAAVRSVVCGIFFALLYLAIRTIRRLLSRETPVSRRP